MAKKKSWHDAAKKREGQVAACGAANDLDKYPALADILLGYEDADGKKWPGGSLVLFYGNAGTLTVMVAPKGCENNFFTEVRSLQDFFAELNEDIERGSGTWRAKKDEPKKK